jgi:hypothetical protein
MRDALVRLEAHLSPKEQGVKRIVLAALLALSLPVAARAQSMKIEINPGKVGIEADDGQGPEGAKIEMGVGPTQGSVTVSGSRTEERTEDGYRIRYESHPQGKTLIKLLAPEGAQVEVWEGSKKIASDDIPTMVNAQADTFYRIIIRAGGAVWEKKLPTKAGMTLSLWVAAPSGGGTVVVRPEPAPAPAPAPAPVGPYAMSGSDFEALKAAIEEEGFGDDKLGVLSTAAGSAWFSCDQVGQLVDLFSFSDEKLKALSLVKDKIVDRNNTFKIFSHFTFSDDKKRAQAMLR